jgi:hypothetical protein
MNVHSVSDVRQIEIYTAEPSIPNAGPKSKEVTREWRNLRNEELHNLCASPYSPETLIYSSKEVVPEVNAQ